MGTFVLIPVSTTGSTVLKDLSLTAAVFLAVELGDAEVSGGTEGLSVVSDPGGRRLLAVVCRLIGRGVSDEDLSRDDGLSQGPLGALVVLEVGSAEGLVRVVATPVVDVTAALALVILPVPLQVAVVVDRERGVSGVTLEEVTLAKTRVHGVLNLGRGHDSVRQMMLKGLHEVSIG